MAPTARHNHCDECGAPSRANWISMIFSKSAGGTAPLTPPDLIVMDLAMPRMNGIEAASVIRATMPNVPIIAFTMYETLAKSMTSSLAIRSVVAKFDGLLKLVDCIQSVLGPGS